MRDHQIDPTIDSFYIKTENCESFFDDFLSIGYGEELRILPSSQTVFTSLCFELGNDTLCSDIVDCSGVLTSKNVLNRIRMKRQ
jgi:hypothetical protein